MNERIKELAEQAGLITNQDTEENNQEYINDLERFAELVRADEREAWAKHIGSVDDPLAQLIANAIRARG
jgi:hypothetical protein